MAGTGPPRTRNRIPPPTDFSSYPLVTLLWSLTPSSPALINCNFLCLIALSLQTKHTYICMQRTICVSGRRSATRCADGVRFLHYAFFVLLFSILVRIFCGLHHELMIHVSDHVYECAYYVKKYISDKCRCFFPRSAELRCVKRMDLMKSLAGKLPSGTLRLGCHVSSIELDPLTRRPLLQLQDGNVLLPQVTAWSVI